MFVLDLLDFERGKFLGNKQRWKNPTWFLSIAKEFSRQFILSRNAHSLFQSQRLVFTDTETRLEFQT